MTDERVIRNRLASLPPIRRARLWRLYAEDGRRFLDLWMDDGRAILGAKGSGIGTSAKAAVDTGLTRPFPSVREARLAKALLARYPGYAAVRFYRDEGRARAAAESVSPGIPLETLRPFAEFLKASPAAPGKAEPRVAMPLFPCPAALAPAALLFGSATDAEAAGGDVVAPLGLACAHRALSEFDRFVLGYDEKLWKRTDRRLGRFFERSGPYLYSRISGEGYEARFHAALEGGVLISPDPERPSIVPGDFDDGELAKLAAALGSL